MKKQILVADDANFMRLMIKDIIREYGEAEFIEAKNGIEAVELFSQHSPDVSIIDVTMPDKDGLKALREIKEIDEKAKVIMCSFLNQQELVVKSFNLGADDFVMKPFKPDRLIQAITDLIGKSE